MGPFPENDAEAATSTIRVDEGLVLRPASKSHIAEIVEAFEETWPDVMRAMPWIKPDKEISLRLRISSETREEGQIRSSSSLGNDTSMGWVCHWISRF
ncbi:MAG: hypothetical protein Ct9H90mP1_1360 [Methanobacteriota archaeon]|nr:MAG: hypothetical protein Ct9H90mP1_1360 [Euryarchaeota archaeon]